MVIPNTDEEWGHAYKALGRPDDAAGYKLEFLSKLPEGTARNEARETAYRAFAHDIGLNEKQASAVAELYFKHITDDAQAGLARAQKARADAEAQLAREWGNAREGMTALAKVAWQEFGSPELAAWMDQTGNGNEPELIKAFARIGKELMGDDKLQGIGARMTETPADIDKQITELRSRHKEALTDRYHPEHRLRVDELTALFGRRFPDNPNGVMSAA
jgi:hypothetical protein